MFGRRKAQEASPEDLAPTAAVAPGSPVDVPMSASLSEFYVWPRRHGKSVVNPASDVIPVPLVGVTWQGSGAITIHVTVDAPAIFDPQAEPQWTLPRDADELLLITFERHMLARVPIPNGAREIHTFVKREGVVPRVVIYMTPSTGAP